ncbi:hypothetical protein M0R45_007679 [Rubus argutus]|uniref:Uncharacterized protein n=1 Tax=Rubus argutus TaxID=59490 RepID=A0AAW1XZE7_RUBAR
MGSESLVHVFLVSFIGQGHVNPLLRLGKRLAAKGLLVTFCTAECVGKEMRKSNGITDELKPVGDGFIRFEFFEDGWAEDEPMRQDLDLYPPSTGADREASHSEIYQEMRGARPARLLPH